jgi:DNA-binding NarL/FixJ family response regulator
MLSAHTEPEEIARVVGMGARGYIPKSSDEEVLRHAISLVLSHNVYVPPSVLSAVADTAGGPDSMHAHPPARPPPANPLDLLTPRQRATLNLIMLGQSNKEIARNLNLLESTVKAHVRVILQKLKASNRTQAARIAAELGWSPTSSSVS